MVRRDERLWEVASQVTDPEIPVLSLADLGVLRAAYVDEEGRAVVEITPTYSGCPAMGTMTADLREALARAGYVDATVRTVLTPAWTTADMTEHGKATLAAYGIAPPTGHGQPVSCPHCGASETVLVSAFGSTSCKALYRCTVCAEPFDYFKSLL